MHRFKIFDSVDFYYSYFMYDYSIVTRIELFYPLLRILLEIFVLDNAKKE